MSLDYPADLAVVEPDAIAGSHVLEDLGQRAADRCAGVSTRPRVVEYAGRPAFDGA